MNLDAIVTILHNEKKIPVTMLETITNENALKANAEHLHAIIATLQNQFSIQHLTTITAQMHPEKEETIQLYYHFWQGEGLTIAIELSTSNPAVISILDLIPGADFYEREVAEMFGVSFTGRETTPPLLLPDQWDTAPPMRKE